MKTLNFDGTRYKLVTTIAEFNSLKSNEIACTKNFKLFNHILGNRGKETGFDEKNVKGLTKIIDSGTYYHELSVITVNKKRTAIDGNNRIITHTRKGLFIFFRVMTADLYNPKDQSKLMIIVANINGYNPSWSAKTMFETAYYLGSGLAHRLADLRSEVCANIPCLSEGDITVNQMMNWIKRDKNHPKASKTNFSEYYEKEEYLNYALTPEFAEEFAYICNVIAYFKNTPFDPARILEQLLSLMWGNDDFNRGKFYTTLLAKKRFVIADVDSKKRAKAIREKILEYAN